MKTASSKTSWVALSMLLLISNLPPALSQGQDASSPGAAGSSGAAGSPGATKERAAPDGKDPESGAVSAEDTLSKLGDKLEKQAEKQESDPSKSTNKVPSVDDLLQSIKQANPQGIEQKSTTTPTNEGISLPTKEPVLLNPGNKQVETPRGSDITTSMTKPTVTAPSPTPASKEPAPKLTVRGGKLFGRIEQISAEGDVTMPVLKAQTPKLDPRGKPLGGSVGATDSGYSGTVATSFPIDFRGTWGGTMSVWSYRSSPAYVSIDRDEAMQSAQILKAGRSGTVNFSFYRDIYNKIAVQPARVLLSVPMKDTHTFAQMMRGSDSTGAMSGLFSQMMGNMEAPVVMLHFGKAATDSLQTGVSGNDFRQEVAKNVLRDLAPGVVEEQIITKWVTKTTSGRVNSGYDESVMRFKKLNDSQLYVLLASVKYSSNGRYLSKLIMSGTVDKGRRMQENPYGNMNQMMGQMMNQGSLQQLFGGSGGGRPIQVPQGGLRMPGGAGGAGNAADSLNDILKQLNQMQR